MTIYNSDASSSSFSLFSNSQQPLPTQSQRQSGRSSRSSKTSNTVVQGGTTNEAPNVVGLTRLQAINALIAAGFDYTISYTELNATSENNDKVVSQSMADLIVALNVYQYTAPLTEVFRIKLSDYPNFGAYPVDQMRFQLNAPFLEGASRLRFAFPTEFSSETGYRSLVLANYQNVSKVRLLGSAYTRDYEDNILPYTGPSPVFNITSTSSIGLAMANDPAFNYVDYGLGPTSLEYQIVASNDFGQTYPSNYEIVFYE